MSFMTQTASRLNRTVPAGSTEYDGQLGCKEGTQNYTFSRRLTESPLEVTGCHRRSSMPKMPTIAMTYFTSRRRIECHQKTEMTRSHTSLSRVYITGRRQGQCDLRDGPVSFRQLPRDHTQACAQARPGRPAQHAI